MPSHTTLVVTEWTFLQKGPPLSRRGTVVTGRTQETLGGKGGRQVTERPSEEESEGDRQI